jgi:glycosyltransferase involved in cell wall biosynthesis
MPLGLGIPTVAVIHDINFEHFPSQHRFWSRTYYRFFFPRFARDADRIITVSRFSKNDICQHYGVPPAKIDVAYNGVNESYRALSESEQERVRAKWTGGQRFFIFIGALIPRKNIDKLLQAFDIYCNKSYYSNVKLVIVGEKMFNYKAFKMAYLMLKNKDRVLFTGRMQPPELSRLLASATALVYPPLFEGFGIPLVEAMATGTAILSSNKTSLPEVAGGAALYFDPSKPEEIANKMIEIEEDNKLNVRLISNGFERVRDFSWDKTASRVWASIEKAIRLT